MIANIPKQLQISSFKFLRLREKRKEPLPKILWKQNKLNYDSLELLNHLENGGNYGCIGGDGNLRILDIDNKEIANKLIKELNTFAVKTCGGTYHFYFISDYNNNHVFKNDVGEFRANNYYVVGANCYAVDPKKKHEGLYTIEKDIPIKEISKEELKKLIKPYLREELQTTPLQNYENETDTRSEKEYRKVISLIKLGKNKEQVFKEMLAFSKWVEAPPQYRELTYNKALKYCETTKPKEIEIKPSAILTYSDILKIKKDKNYIVQDFLRPESVTMIHSPPTYFKSLLVSTLSFAVTNGKEWLGLKTKKNPVLYLDGENSLNLIKERYKQIYSGMNLKRKKFPLYLLKTGLLIDSKKNVQEKFIASLEKEIVERKIKVLIFDTMHRFAFYDENKSDDINILYTRVFKPLTEKYNLAIVFLHHSTKTNQGGSFSYRGSGDFLGMVDVAYSIYRKPHTNNFYIQNEKNRGGEIDKIYGEFIFTDNSIKLIRHSEKKEEKKSIEKLKEVTVKIEEMFDEQTRMRRKEIIESLELMKFDFGSSKTLDRALKFLVEERKTFDKDKGVYWKILK